MMDEELLNEKLAEYLASVYSWMCLVYVPVSTDESKTIRNEFLHHIGGQSHVTCAKHDDALLIVSAVCEHCCRCGAKGTYDAQKSGVV
jgi:hypothetical protein